MHSSRTPLLGAAGAALALTAASLLGGCVQRHFKEPVTLGGVKVEAATLNLGRDTYLQYCRACHGVNGDGKGPASKGLRPPPRDFRQGTYKFVAVESGSLPNDDDFKRIVRRGLDGTAMLPWDISDRRLEAVVQYIKTFSPRWTDPQEEKGKPIVAPEDPFGPAREAAAVALGKKLYHGLAQCLSCHPAYATYPEIYTAGVELTGVGRTDLDAKIYTPELKDSDYGVKIYPPDFTFHRIRSGTDLADLYRTIAAGIGGTAMPTWEGSLPDEQLWALAYYVRSLARLRGTSEALQLKAMLRNQPPWTAPPAQGQSKG
jgi:mono/diheme cytochrome c family protein